MTAPDAPPDRLTAAANDVGQQIQRLVLQAHCNGARDGLEAAAMCCDQFAANAAANTDVDPAVRDFAVDIIRRVRDELRLIGLQVPDPDTAGGTGG